MNSYCETSPETELWLGREVTFIETPRQVMAYTRRTSNTLKLNLNSHYLLAPHQFFAQFIRE